MSKTLILVPARYNSSRFPGKPLAKIHNKAMIEYVVQNCEQSGFDYAIVTDDSRIEDYVKSVDGQVVRIDDPVETGSERIALAYQRYFADKNYDYVVNVQGDEPLLTGNIIKEVGMAHEASPYDIFTGVKRRKSSEESFKNSNIVKCVYVKKTSACLYFSRESIPHCRDGEEHDWHQHIGIYSYKVKALNDFVKFETGTFENLEKLEQLRALENGLTIGAIELDLELIGVDTPEDIGKIEGVLSER